MNTQPWIPARHQSDQRSLIEESAGWRILAMRRGTPAYEECMKHGCAPLQLMRFDRDLGLISLLTPSFETEGRFELYYAGDTRQFCCYKCVQAKAAVQLGLRLPKWDSWMMYALLDAPSYLYDPRAPKERPA